ncbi:hypothetical protein F4818DRAFT_433075 [Hypoxylon cercidicola]|nr:hypothetical protein F4818DRAFT_433075 [Hypoxylon cercidicola]
MKFNVIYTAVAIFCGMSAALPAVSNSVGEETSIAERFPNDDSGLTTDGLVLTPELEPRNNQQLQIFWRRQGPKMIIRVVGLLTPGWAAAGGIVGSLQSVPEVSAAISATIRSGLIKYVSHRSRDTSGHPQALAYEVITDCCIYSGANGIHGVIAWVYGTFTPTYTFNGGDSSVGVDIATTSALGNIPDQQILNNVVQLLQSWGFNVPTPQQDNSLGLPQKRHLAALNARQLSNGAQQFCLNPNTEILKVIGNGKASTSLTHGTACP